MSEIETLKCDACGATVAKAAAEKTGWLALRHGPGYFGATACHFCGRECEREYEARRLGLVPAAGANAGAHPYRKSGVP